ncbi:Hypothetical predicted protein [Pelobates cultripes]|uniref:Uncharacterized protein n=1 Tax=Pelobates cultripes TaxID=61616 RepID=A0AAD1SYV6_PELCU|nr:Hypothetical predicted protein [Pelobates cultripes]
MFQKITSNHIDIGLQSRYLDQKLAKFLFVPHPKHPVLFTPPKIHKDTKNPTDRPIVSAKEGIIQPIAQHVNYYIKDCVRELLTYLRNTQDFFQHIRKITLDDDVDTLLVTLDVQILYTVISHTLGIHAFREMFCSSYTYKDGDGYGTFIRKCVHVLFQA